MADWNDLKKPLGLDLARHHVGPTLNANDISELKIKLPTSGRALIMVIEKIEATLDKGDDPGKRSANQLARHIAANVIEIENTSTPNPDELESRARLIAAIKSSEPYTPLADIKGLGLGIFDVGQGLASSIMHPIDTAQGLVNTFTHPIDSWRAMQKAERTRLIEILRTDDADARRAAYAEMDTAALFNTYLAVAGGTASIRSAANLGKSGLNAIKQHLDNMPPGAGGVMVTPEGLVMNDVYAAKTGDLVQKTNPFSLGIVAMADKENNSGRDSPITGTSQNAAPATYMEAEKRHALIQRFVTDLLNDQLGSPEYYLDMRQNIMATLRNVFQPNSIETQQQAINTLWNQVRYLAPHDNEPAAWINYASRTRYLGDLLEQELNAENTSTKIELAGLAEGTQGIRHAYIPDYKSYPSIYTRADKAFGGQAVSNYENTHPTEKVLTRIPLSKELSLNPEARAVLVTEEQTSGFRQTTNVMGEPTYAYEFGHPKYKFIVAENELSQRPSYINITPELAKQLVNESEGFNQYYPDRDIAQLAIDRSASWNAVLEMADPSPGAPGL